MPFVPPTPGAAVSVDAAQPMVYWGQIPSPGTPLKPKQEVPSGYNWETQKDEGPVESSAKSTWDAEQAKAFQGGPISASQAQGKLLEMLNTDPAEYKRLTEKMLTLGLLRPGYSFPDVVSQWNNAVGFAANIGPQSQVTPEAALDLIAQGGDQSAAGGSTGQSTVKQYTSQTVEALVNGAFKTAVGRNATKAERAKFLEYINKQEAAHPATQTVNGSTQTYTGGVDETQLAQDYANTNAPDVERTEGSQFYNVLKSMVG